jgi:hypothetical protein
VTDQGGPRRGPLWRFVPHVAHVPQVRYNNPAPGGERPLPRDVTPEDLLPLRSEGEWRPIDILRRFGPAKLEKEYTSRLLVACAVICGVYRIRDLTERQVAMLTIAMPRIARMLDDKTVERRHAALKEIYDRANAARQDLPATRARASNELDDAHPDGLRSIDLEMLVAHMQTVIEATEVATKRNLTGIDFALHAARSIPDQRYVEEWLDRALGTADLPGILLFTPAEYGRVVVVYEDGRLAYDPGAASPAFDPDSRQ